MEKTGNDEIVKLGFAEDRVHAEIIIDVLKQNGIYAYRKGAGMSDIMELYTGRSSDGENILVNREDAEKAKELVENLLVSENKSPLPRRSSKITQIFAILVLIGFAVTMFLAYYVNM